MSFAVRHRVFVVALVATACLTASVFQQVSAMTEPWFRLEVSEEGRPDYTFSPKLSRAQREALEKLRSLDRESDLSGIECELDGVVLGGQKARHWGQSGVWGFSFYADGRAVVSDEFDIEAGVFVRPRMELEMPLAEFAELFRAWAASVRHWRRLTELHGDPLPRKHWPASYPPPTRG